MNGTDTKPDTHESDLLTDSLIITRPLYKHALTGFVVLGLVTLVWTFFGSIPQRVEGVGEVNTSGGLLEVSSAHNGRVVEVKTAINNEVKKDEILFILEQPELQRNIEEVENELQLLQAKKSKMVSGNEAIHDLKSSANVIEEKRILAQIVETDKTLSYLEKKIEQLESLVADGLVTATDLFEGKAALASARSDKEELTKLLLSVSLSTKEWELGENMTEDALGIDISKLEKELIDLRNQYLNNTEVTSPIAGNIVQIDASFGEVVHSGSAMATVEIPDNHLNYVLSLYVPFTTNALIEKGMLVDIEPYNVDRNLYGWLEGTVESVNKYVSSDSSLQGNFANEELVKLVTRSGPVFEVRVKLHLDPGTVSGFAWSNKKGPPYQLNVGTLCQAFVRVKDKSPIDYLIPIFKKYFY
ncbi:MAG: NHLP bacteriocin system secretion protein [Gammaproteobacteria bacterium]|nr:NHLP bacteriocin system secretion protein [Gammaproteobacteria bacterium]